ncbi:MAG: bifunctional aldolase/short-chain dehydrogenase [Proteobacteria bacterium]|nr:bifunctional aldolase/short-chain dehydrogenase [Pseudomonadota bacterium]
MKKPTYNEAEARKYIRKHSTVPKNVALRIYTSHLLGRDPSMVLHGGGNTSVKIKRKNLLGKYEQILLVKGSGRDMASIGFEGFVPLKLNTLLPFRSLNSLGDEAMVNLLLTSKTCADSPDPSVEALLHAFLPFKFVDHTHADTILTLTNRKSGTQLVEKILGPKAALLPYITSGYPLAKAVYELHLQRPDIEAIVVAHHGIFTFSDDAKTSYKRMLEYVNKTDGYLRRKSKKKGLESKKALGNANRRQADARKTAALVQTIRGTCAFPTDAGTLKRFLVEIRSSPGLIDISHSATARKWCRSGVVTPDHVIRTKNQYVYVPVIPDESDKLRSNLVRLIEKFQTTYNDYFAKQEKDRPGRYEKLDPFPRVFLVAGVGLVALGETRKEAIIAADIAERTLTIKQRSNQTGVYRPLAETHVFDMEYWGPQRKKLSSESKPLMGQSAIVTGAGGAIGFGVADRLLAEGAVVAATDIDKTRLKTACEILSAKHGESNVESIVFDVTDFGSVEKGLRELSLRIGGIDIIVPNAGVAYVARIEDLDPDRFDQVVAVNLKGTVNLIKAAVPILRRQGTGGNIVLVSSKNVFDPGAAFGAYSASKAAAHQICRIAALELAELGVRVNMVNPDAVFGDEKISSKLWDLIGPDRMKARGLDEAGLQDYYRQRNLLKATVSAEHVGNAVVFFASEQTPTTGATLPIDGGIPAAFPR